jgi:hypothetical protein
MSVLKTVTTTVFGLSLMGAMFSPSAKADDWNHKTKLTFSAPVEIPAVHLKGWGVLPAGTYVFRVLDSQSDRHIIQISNEDETVVYATVLAIPNYRLKTTDKSVITFRERPNGRPEAIRAWFYPGMNWGEEFVYHKAMAVDLAKAENTTVLFTPAELPLEIPEPAFEPVVAQLKQAPVAAIKPTGEEVELAVAVTPPPAVEPAPVAPVQVASAELPKTASPMALFALLGLLSIGAGVTLRTIQKRIV